MEKAQKFACWFKVLCNLKEIANETIELFKHTVRCCTEGVTAISKHASSVKLVANTSFLEVEYMRGKTLGKI